MQWISLTLSVCSAADYICEFRFETCVGGATLARAFKAAGTEWDHTLQGRVRPQTLRLMDSQCCGVVNQQASILWRTEQVPCYKDFNWKLWMSRPQSVKTVNWHLELKNLSRILTVNGWIFLNTEAENRSMCCSTAAKQRPKLLFLSSFPHSISQISFDIEQLPRSASSTQSKGEVTGEAVGTVE